MIEQANECSGARERRKQMSEQCEQTSERTSEWPSTLRVDFMPFLSKVQRWRIGGGSGGGDGGGAQWDKIA